MVVNVYITVYYSNTLYLHNDIFTSAKEDM